MEIKRFIMRNLLMRLWRLASPKSYGVDQVAGDPAEVQSSYVAAAAAAKSLQSCPTLCDPRDVSPLGSSVPGILQARILEWGAITFSNA